MSKMDEMDGKGSHAALNTSLIAADVLAFANKTLGDERLPHHDHGHIEQVTRHQFAAADRLDLAKAFCHHLHHHMATRLVIDRDACACWHIDRIDGAACLIYLQQLLQSR